MPIHILLETAYWRTCIQPTCHIWVSIWLWATGRLPLTYFLPIASCIFGAAFSEAVKSQLSKVPFMEIGVNLPCFWKPQPSLLWAVCHLSLPNILVTLFVSFFMGFQLCLFRTCLGVAHNTTICTGNIRNVGQKLYQVLTERSGQSLKTFLTFANLTFSFAVGAVPGILFSARYGGKSSLAVQRCSGGFGLVDLEMRAKALRGITLHSAFLLHRIEIW